MSQDASPPSAPTVLSQMTLQEKIDYLSGVDGMYTKPLLRLGIPAIRMADSTTGFRDAKLPATAFPATIALVATWNRALCSDYATAVAAEFNAAGVHVNLGPGMNIYRVHQCGRNFEYMGEDPFLAGEMAVAYIRATQQTGVAATAKHFACNNADWHRCQSDSVVDERTLREIYLPAFEAAVTRGKVRAIMTAYNKLNGDYCGENSWLLRDVLLGEWGFDGLVMSDWGGLWDCESAVTGGLHLEMPSGEAFQPSRVKNLLDRGIISEADVDEKVLRILEFVLRVSSERAAKLSCGKPKCREHAGIALQTAREGIVLLRNEGNTLPLSLPGGRIAVVGPAAADTPTSGGGAAGVTPVQPVDIVSALAQAADGTEILRDDAAETLAEADAVVVCVGLRPALEGEGFDRPFELPSDHVALIRRAAAANPRTIVVLTCGGGVEMGAWCEDVGAVLHQWYPGENGCQALAEILFGETNPSGRLPITIERNLADAAASGSYLPEGATMYGEPDFVSNVPDPWEARYSEGVLTGYRHVDARGIEPLYCFGHGLSYTSFEYSDLVVTRDGNGATVEFTLRNSGDRDGADVAQVYVAPAEAPVPRPPRELKGFAKVCLAAGESARLAVSLDARAFAFYDVAAHDWSVVPGEYGILVGASSRDIRLRGTVAMGQA